MDFGWYSSIQFKFSNHEHIKRETWNEHECLLKQQTHCPGFVYSSLFQAVRLKQKVLERRVVSCSCSHHWIHGIIEPLHSVFHHLSERLIIHTTFLILHRLHTGVEKLVHIKNNTFQFYVLQYPCVDNKRNCINLLKSPSVYF